MTALKVFSAIYDVQNEHPLMGEVRSRIVRLIGVEQTTAAPQSLTPVIAQSSRRSAPSELTATINGKTHVVSLSDVAHSQAVRLFTCVIADDLSSYAGQLAKLGIGEPGIEAWLSDARGVLNSSDEAPSEPLSDCVVPLTLRFRSRAIPSRTYIPYQPRELERRAWWKPWSNSLR